MAYACVGCPECGDRFTVPVHTLSDNLGRPIPESHIVDRCGCMEPGR